MTLQYKQLQGSQLYRGACEHCSIALCIACCINGMASYIYVTAGCTGKVNTHLSEQPFEGLVEEGRLVCEGPLHPFGHQALA